MPAPSLALVGASTLLGKEVKEQLADAGYPGSAVTLVDLEEAAGLVTEYGDEARVVLEAAEAELQGRDLVCFCDRGEMADTYLPRLLEAGRFVLDCTGRWAQRQESVLTLPTLRPHPAVRAGHAMVLPGSVAQLLATVLAALDDPDLGDVAATVLVPASESGDPGLDELARQSIAVLNLEELPTETFGRQLAFDVWPVPGDQGIPTIAAQLRQLGVPVPALSVVQVPVFHAAAATLHVAGLDADRARELLDAVGLLAEEGTDGDDATDSPIRVAGSAGVRVGAVRGDDAGGCWVWALMDNLRARAAAAVATVEAVVGRPDARPV